MNSSMSRKLQYPTPAPLMVSRSSSKMKKTVVPDQGRSSPVIVYLKSPDIIHVRPEDFMGTVQRLTGKAETFSTATSSPPPTSCAPWFVADHLDTMKNEYAGPTGA
uniref:VQ domain-containing protein n=1 Tax=Salix viminalis TaxID=40686 RepID=A0A6N2N6E8_SALVM